MADEVKMKDSGVDWIGQIPEHWSIAKLGDICKVQTGKVPAKSEEPSGEYPFFTANTSKDCFIDSYSYDTEAVLVSKDGEYAGFPRYYSGKFEVSNHSFLLTNIKINAKYLYKYLVGINEHVKTLRSGIAIPSISMKILSDIDVIIPTAEEQQSIAEELTAITSNIDSVVSNTEKMIEELKAYKSAIISEYVTGKKQV